MSSEDESSRRLSDQIQERLANADMFAFSPEIIDQNKRLTRFPTVANTFLEDKGIFLMKRRPAFT